MNQPLEQQAMQDHYEDEINLKDLFHNIWRTRVTWVIALLVVSMVFWGIWALKTVALPNVKTYGLSVNLVFENIDKGQYPNKTLFNRSDIVTSSVLSEVYDINQIEKYKVSQTEFLQMINIAPYTPDMDAIELKYAKKLADSKKMTPQDIDIIQKQKNKEVLSASQRGALIQLTELNANQIPKNIIDKVLQDIYKVWADKAVNERNVLKTDIALVGSLSLDKSLIDELDYSIALDYVKDKMDLVKQAFNLVLELPNSKTAVDPETGLSIEDMSRSIHDRLEYQLKLVEAPIIQLGITRHPDLTKIYYLEALYKLNEESNKLDLNAKAVQQTLEQYTGYQVKESSQDSGVIASSAISPQFSGDFLDKIISLSSESTEAKYKQELSEKLLEFKQWKNEVIVKTRVLERKIKALSLNDVDVDVDVAVAGVRVQTIQLLNTRIPELLKVLSDYLAASQRIYERLDQESISGNGALYQLDGKGVIVKGGYLASIKRSVIAYFIFLFLATIVVVPWKMFKNAK